MAGSGCTTDGSLRHIVLAGFMGTGKTTVGRLVAGRLGWPFTDTASVIEARAGCSIADLFAQQGEAAFRALEVQVCAEIAAGSPGVIATGGGALLHIPTRALVSARGLVICLSCDLATLIKRVGYDPARPLFSADRERLAALYAARAAHYRSLPHQIDTTGKTPAQITEEIVTLWQHQQP